MAGGLTAGGAALLPALRQDLSFVQDFSGAERCWRVHDPLQHRFFRISDDTGRILSLWRGGQSFDQLVAAARETFGIDLTAAGFSQLVQFLHNSNLFDLSGTAATQAKPKAGLSAGGLIKKALALVFLKFPLVNPEPLLKAIRPYSDLIFTLPFGVGMAIIAMGGLYLSLVDLLAEMTAQWDGIGLGGFFAIGLALIILKSCHEMGHAVTAWRYGCRVPTLGVAFMAFFPLLYTDVTDAWRLEDRRKRLVISSAGIIVELGLASIATFLWAFLGEGTAKDIAFYIATAGWISSLAFNLNPFARFDGYFILSDLVGMENLQTRAINLARWKIRRLLIAPGLEAPEPFERGKAALLMGYAVFTVLYRIGVYVGISMLLYHFAGKAIGIFMMAACVFQYLLMPVVGEVAAWRKLAEAGGGAAFGRPLILAGMLLLLFVAPLSSSVSVPAVLLAGDLQKVFPPLDAQVVAVHVSEGQKVASETPLVSFEVPELAAEMNKVEIERKAAERKLARAVSSQSDRSQMAVLRNDLTALSRRLETLEKQADELEAFSRQAGTVVQLSRKLRPGAWVSQHEWMAIIRPDTGLVSRGYISESDLDRISVGNSARFIPNDPSRGSLHLVVKRISQDAAGEIELPELSSRFGGPIATRTDSDGLAPVHPFFAVELSTDENSALPNQAVSGTVIVEGRRKSLASLVWKHVARVFVREAVF